MRTIAVVSNWESERCGIRAFGSDLSDAFNAAGYAVFQRHWGSRIPQDIHTIYNWHPHTAPEIAPPDGPCTVIAHEVPPHVAWPEWFTRDSTYLLPGEPWGNLHMWYPVLDYLSPCHPPADGPFRLGTTSIRGDGIELLRQVCGKNGWEFSHSPTDRFASRQEEIDRLASCHAVALWYWATGRARSLALPVAIAARRRTVVTASTMLADAMSYGLSPWGWTDDLDEITAAVGAASYPDEYAIERRTWSVFVGHLRRAWRDRGIEL